MNYFKSWMILVCLLIPALSLAAPQSARLNILSLADIHFDPFTGCIGNAPCPLIDKLRYAEVEQWPKILAQHDVTPPRFKQDTNYRLLISALKASHDIAEASHAQFILLLGDSLGHESRSRYKRYSSDKKAVNYSQFVHKIFQFLNKQLAAAFPSQDVYIAVGNNDSYQGDYVIKPDGQFFHDTAELWSRLIKSPSNQLTMQKQFSYAGYYSIVLPYPDNLRLIVMNTNVFSVKARGKVDGVAWKELDWLHAELNLARKNHQSVFIMMHIPPGIDWYATSRTRFRLVSLWKPEYSKRFESELDLFSAEIAGVFSGHLHRNWFQVISPRGNEIPLIGVTSISPIFGNSPGFTSISYFTDPVHLDDFSNYSLSFAKGAMWVQNNIAKEMYS